MNSRGSQRHFLVVCSIVLSLIVSAAIAAQQPDGDKSKDEILTVGRDGTSMPKCQYCPPPEYSKEARKKKYQGVVVLMIVVSTEGKTKDIRVVKSPGLGLDEKAIEAVRKWRFKPAVMDGRPLDTQVPVEVTFRLH